MMARIELAAEVLEDVERILDHLSSHQSTRGLEEIATIMEALDVLAHSPRIGRPVSSGKRELVIGTSGNGYVALYRYFEEAELGVVIGSRSQREAIYTH